MRFPHRLSRRNLLRSAVGGSLLMSGILGELLNGGEPSAAALDPLAPHPPHFPAKAKRVIYLYMSGGTSHVDTFDYKPKLYADHGKTVRNGKFLKRPVWDFKPRGKCGTQISELFPKIAECADDL